MPNAPSIPRVSTQPNLSILLTRPLDQANLFARDLQKNGIAAQAIIVAPVLKIHNVAPDLSRFNDHIILATSANAIGFDGATRFVKDRRCIVVGRKTADAFENKGGLVEWVGGTVVDLCDYLQNWQKPQPVVYLRGEFVTNDFADESFSRIGIKSCITYHQERQKIPESVVGALIGGTTHLLPLFSLRSAKLLNDQIGGFRQHMVITISDVVAQYCREAGAQNVHVSKTPDATGMLKKTLELAFEAPYY